MNPTQPATLSADIQFGVINNGRLISVHRRGLAAARAARKCGGYHGAIEAVGRRLGLRVGARVREEAGEILPA